MRRAALALAALLAAPFGWSQDTETAPNVTGSARADPDAALAQSFQNRLASDPAAAKSLAMRILDSRIAPYLTNAKDPDSAAQNIQAWIMSNPADASHLAAGFAQDDAHGTREFETSLFERSERQFRLSRDRYNGVYGQLHELAGLSKSLKSGARLSDEERREAVKRFFEGVSNRAPSENRGGAVSAARDKYDRLSAANLTGFSTEILALQSELNRARPPGAPPLKETGKLGYETLRYPFHALRYDIDRLSAVLKSQQEYLQGLGKAADPGFARRRDAITRAEAALAGFDAEAEKTKDSARITPQRLLELAALRRESARWITVAALEERLYRLGSLNGFMGAPLKAAVAACPVDENLRGIYLARGEKLSARLQAELAGIERAISLLRADAGGAGLEEADRLNRASREAIKRLPSAITRYVETAQRLASASSQDSSLRARIGRWMSKNSDQESALREEFARIAASP